MSILNLRSVVLADYRTREFIDRELAEQTRLWLDA